MFQLRLKGVLSNFKGVSRVFEKSLKGVSGKYHWCFKKVSKKFQGATVWLVFVSKITPNVKINVMTHKKI